METLELSFCSKKQQQNENDCREKGREEKKTGKVPSHTLKCRANASLVFEVFFPETIGCACRFRTPIVSGWPNEYLILIFIGLKECGAFVILDSISINIVADRYIFVYAI